MPSPAPLPPVTSGTTASVLEEVVVIGRADDLLGTASSASEGRVGATEISNRPYLRRGELLETIPGVVITQHSGDGKANQYFLRGFNLDHGTDFSIAVDGLPVNTRTHAHGQGYADLNFLIPELIESVEYKKGPFYASVGDFSGAGAANFSLFNTLPSGLATLSLGENHYRRFLVADSPRLGPGSLLYAFESEHDDGPWEVAEDANRYNGLLRYSWDNGGDFYRLTGSLYHAYWNSTDQIPKRAVEAGSLSRFGTVDPSDGGESQRGSLAFDWIREHLDGTTRKVLAEGL